MRPEAPHICVEGDASLLLPLLGADLFSDASRTLTLLKPRDGEHQTLTKWCFGSPSLAGGLHQKIMHGEARAACHVPPILSEGTALGMPVAARSSMLNSNRPD